MRSIGMFLSLMFAFPVWALDTYSFLKQFHENPRKMMERLPDEVIDGQPKARGDINYDELRASAFAERMKTRDAVMEHSDPILQPLVDFDQNNLPRTLIDEGTVISSVVEIDQRGLSRFNLPTVPWTDSYWPHYRGSIGTRYADEDFPFSKYWSRNYEYVNDHPAREIYEDRDANDIDELSPAEKYDLLVGDPYMTLTNFAWGLGREYQEREGGVPRWVGICHGWASAAHMQAPVLRTPISLLSPEGVVLKFYQSDFKALTSMLWASASPPTRFVGNRCKDVDPPRDGTGRITTPTCWDVNPGTLHLSLVNQLGVHRRSFILDTTYDLEVWNFSVVAYNFSYFNPQTWQTAPSLQGAIVPLAQYSVDKFRSYRSPRAQYVVGVVLDLTYVNTLPPTRAPTGTAPLKVVRYMYDLELDGNYNVLGGEWYQVAHPDFLWTHLPGAQAKARGDSGLNPNEWDVRGSVPASWRGAAQRSSAAGEPLHSVLKRMLDVY